MAWSSTLVYAVTATDQLVCFSSYPIFWRPGSVIYIESEAVGLRGYAGGSNFYVDRGVMGTDNVAHAAGSAVGRVDVVTPSNGTSSGSGSPFPVGSLFLSAVTTDPATLLGYGTWQQVAKGMMIVGQLQGDPSFGSIGNLAGSWSHGHTVTQPDAHAALSHTGTAVGDHATVSHSAHTGAAVADHTVTQPNAHSNHVVTQPAAHADNIAHTHGLNVQGGTTAATTGTHIMTSTAVGGSARAITSGDAGLSSGTGASLTHSATAVDAHSAHAGAGVSAHGVTQAGAHSDHTLSVHSVTQPGQHGSQSHSGTAVAASATTPPTFVAYIWQRTA